MPKAQTKRFATIRQANEVIQDKTDGSRRGVHIARIKSGGRTRRLKTITFSGKRTSWSLRVGKGSGKEAQVFHTGLDEKGPSLPFVVKNGPTSFRTGDQQALAALTAKLPSGGRKFPWSRRSR